MKVTVTQEHIDQGTINRENHEWTPYYCPVALATREAFPDVQYVSAGISILAVGGRNYNMPEEAKLFISKFDTKEPVEPFTFELDDSL